MAQNNESVINVVILVSGNGTNMENLVLSLHNKTLSQSLRQNGMNLAKNTQKQDCEKANKIDNDSQTLKINSTISNNMLLKDPKIQVISVISNKANAYALKRAKSLGIPHHTIESNNREEFDNELLKYLKELESKHGLDCILLAGFIHILGSKILKSLSHIRILNIHPSFLPLHKGLNSIKRSFDDSNDFGGVSVHFVSEELDSGMIILQEKIQKIANESFEDFEERIHDLEYKLYPQAFLKAIAQGIHNV